MASSPLRALVESPAALVRVLTYLSVRDRCACAGTSRAWWRAHCSDPLWETLSLAGASPAVARDEVVARLLRAHGAAVAVLDLSLCAGLTDRATAGWGAAAGGARLRAASLEGCRSLGDAGVAALAAGSPGLDALNLAGCASLTVRGIFAVAERCPALASLSLGSVPAVNDEVLAGLGRGCPALAALSVAGCAAVTNAGVTHFARARGAALREIDLSYCGRLTDESVVALVSACPALRAVSLYGCGKLTDTALHWLGRLPQLQSLDLSMCRAVGDAGLAALVAPHRGRSPLAALNVAFCGVTDAGLLQVAAGAPSLSFLGVFGAEGITAEGLRAALARMPGLARLDAGGGVDEAHLEQIERDMTAARAARGRLT